MSSVSHIILCTLFFYVFYVYGVRIGYSKQASVYWRNCIILIIIWCIVEGTRYGRGPDYFWYKFQYEHSDQITSRTQIVFFTINRILLWMSLPYPFAFSLYAFIFIISVLYLTRYWKREAAFMPIFMLCSVLEFHETFVRQILSIGMVIFSLKLCLDKNYKYAVLWCVLSFYTHNGALLLFIPALLVYLFFAKKPIPALYAVPIYLIIALFSNFNWIEGVQDVLSRISVNIALFQRYLNRSEYWFSENAIREEWKQSTFAFIMRCIFDISFILLSYRMLYHAKKEHQRTLITSYNLSVIGCILYRLFWYLEMMRRIIFPLYILWFIPVGYAFYVFQRTKDIKIIMIKILIVLYLFLYQGRFVFFNPTASYLWDQRVKEHIKGTYVIRDI